MKAEVEDLKRDLKKVKVDLSNEVRRAKTYKRKFKKCMNQRNEQSIFPAQVRRVTLRRRHIRETPSPVNDELENLIKTWKSNLNDDLFVAKRRLKEYKERFVAAESQRHSFAGIPRVSDLEPSITPPTPENEKFLKQKIEELETKIKNLDEEEKKQRITITQALIENRKQEELKKKQAETRKEAEKVEFDFRENQKKEQLEKSKKVVQNSGLFLSTRKKKN